MMKYFFICLLLVSFFAKGLLIADATVTGTVTDQVTGLPISGATIDLIRGNQLRYSDTTNTNGQYLITNIQPSNYDIVVTAAGYQDQIVGVKLNNNQTTTIDFALIPTGGAISGIVTDVNTTNLIVGATLRLFLGNTFVGTTTTNGFGSYAFNNLAPGSYNIVATASGYGAQVKGAFVVAGNTTIVNFALNTLQGTISGTVTDALTTNPIAGATVTFLLNGKTTITSVDTDVNGNYVMPNLSPGNYVVVAIKEGYQTKIAGAIVTAGNTTTVNFALLANPGTIEGIITRSDTGAPIASATVAIFQQFNFIGSVLTSIDGTYSFPDLAPGRYVVLATAANFQGQIVSATVVSNATTIVNLSLAPRPGTIMGRVVDAATSAPISGSIVRVLDGPVLIADAITDSNGDFVISNIAPGDYSVVASASGFQSQFSSVSVNAGNTTTANFALRSPPGTIAGVVTDAVTTLPIAGASVAVFQGTTLIAEVITDANGIYSMPEFAPGSYNVVASAPNYQTAFTTASVSANATTVVNFALNGNPGAIVGTVTDRCTGSGIPGVLIIALEGSSFVTFGITDSNGQFVIDELGTGNYTLIIAKRNFVTATTVAVVTAGSTTTTANIVLTPKALPPQTISGKAFYNRFLTQKERVHCIEWTQSPSKCIVKYQIFRNGSLVKTVSASNPLQFCDHNRSINKRDVYSVRAVNEFGQVSDLATIELK